MGFRRIAAVARKLNGDAEIYFIATGNLYSMLTHLFPSRKKNFYEYDLDNIAQELANSEIVCFSCMSPSSDYVIKISERIKRINPDVFLLWGGPHTMLYPERSINFVDAICCGEGEIPFEIFYRNFSGGGDYFNTPSIWFNSKRGIIKNKSINLNSSCELNSLPHLYYGLDCKIYDLIRHKFRKFTYSDYLKYNGLTYRTIWTMGCPFSCSYCANSAFIKIDKGYTNIRYPSIEYILDEIDKAKKTYPFISTVVFYDDHFLAISLEDLRNFSEEYKKRINLPFVVFGMHPNFITRKKIEILCKAGMNRVRMGIQSGSEETLSFYNRNTMTDRIKDSVTILADTAKKYKMIPPAYDIISDNPIETKKNVSETLRFIYELKRPFTLTIFSLRVFPATQLWDYFQNNPEIDIRGISSSYLETRKSLANIVLYMLAVVNPPQMIFSWLLKYVTGYKEKQKYYPFLYFIVKGIYLVSRGIAHLRRLDFTTIVGPWGYYLWRMGFIK